MNVLPSPPCDVLVLAAGFGTRLKPYTEQIPKPLLEVGGETLISRNLRHLARAGFRHCFINLHYLGNSIRSYVGDGSKWGLKVSFSQEDPILDTGGAIRNIENELQHPILLTLNSDVLLSEAFNLRRLVEHHSASQTAVATMLLRGDPDVESYGSLGVAKTGRVVEFLGRQYVDMPVSQRLMFSGIQVLSSAVFKYMPPRGSVFSITRDTLPRVLSDDAYVNSLLLDTYWNDVGTHKRFAEAQNDVAAGRVSKK